MSKPNRPENRPENTSEHGPDHQSLIGNEAAGEQNTPGEKKKKKPKKTLPDKTEKAEIGGPKGPEPTRYGDWERKGRAIDF